MTIHHLRRGPSTGRQQVVVMHIKDGKITETWLQSYD
jgi:hypothetical protein